MDPRADTSHAHGSMFVNVASLAADDIHAATDRDLAFLYFCLGTGACMRPCAVSKRHGGRRRLRGRCESGQNARSYEEFRAGAMRLPCGAQYVKMPNGWNGMASSGDMVGLGSREKTM